MRQLTALVSAVEVADLSWHCRAVNRTRGVRALAWAALGQGLSSLSNVVLSLALARGSGLEGLGQFTLALSVYLLVIAFQRALVTDPLLVVRRSCDRGGPEERSALTCCLGVGIAGGVGALLVGVVTGQPQLSALAVVLPLMTTQDGARFIAFRRLDARGAALIDAIWVAASVAAWAPVQSGSAALAVMLWGAGAAVSLAFGVALLGVRPTTPRNAVRWWRRDGGEFGVALGIDAALASAAVQAGTFVVAGLLGAAAVGSLRSAQIVVGPAIMLLTAYNAFALPRFAAGANGMSRRDALRASMTTVALVTPVLAVGWGAGGPVARVLFGRGVAIERSILAGLVAGTVVAAASVGVVLYLKATRRGRPLVAARLVAAITGLALISSVAAIGEVRWLGWAIAGQTTVYLSVLLLLLRRRPHPTEGRGSARAGDVVSPGYAIT